MATVTESAPPMRDIRNDLQQRLAAVDGRYADAMARYEERLAALHKEYSETITALDRERTVLKELLALECRRDEATPEGAAAYLQRAQLRLPLVDFIITKV